LYIDIAAINATKQFEATNAQVHQIGSVLFPKSLRNVAEVVQGETPTYFTLGQALQIAGLVPTLSTSTKYTLFAPTDTAFAAPSVSGLVNTMLTADNPAALRSFLSYHVVQGEILNTELQALGAAGGELTTIGGYNVSVTIDSASGSIKINDAVVPAPTSPMTGTNGLVHQISAVLLPPDMRTILGVVASTPYRYSTIETYITAAGLASTLNGGDEYTLFVPPNPALLLYNDSIYPFYQAAVNATKNTTGLSDFLKYHLVKGKKFAAQLTNQTLITVLGETINVMTATNGSVYINDALVSTPNVAATNGVVHVLSDTSVLWPSQTRNGDMFVKANPAKYTTLLTKLTTCSLNTYLASASNNFTLFAPTDGAFTRAGLGAYTSTCSTDEDSILKYHVVNPSFSLADLSSGTMLSTLSEPPASRRAGHAYKLEVWRPASSSDIYIDNARLVPATAAQLTNGYAYQLDAVLIPPHLRNIVQWTKSIPSKFFDLTTAITVANLTSVLESAPVKKQFFTVYNQADAPAACAAAVGSKVPDSCCGSAAATLSDAQLDYDTIFSQGEDGVDQCAGPFNVYGPQPFEVASRLVRYPNNTFSYSEGCLQSDGTGKDCTRCGLPVVDKQPFGCYAANAFPNQVWLIKVSADNNNDPATYSALYNTTKPVGPNSQQMFTVFAPNEGAFVRNKTAVNELLRNNSDPRLQDLLLNHIVYGVWPSPLQVGTVMRAISGISITIHMKGGKYYANEVELASLTGIKATNGIIYETKEIIFGALPIPATAIAPPPMNLVPKGMCPEYAGVLLGSKVKIASYISGPAPGGAFATAKLSADSKSMVVSVYLDNPIAQPKEQSFGKEVKSITIRGPVQEGGNGDAAFSFEYDYTVCSKAATPCPKRSAFTRVFKVTTQILSEMDAGLYYIEITNGLNQGLRGTLTRQQCFEAYLNQDKSTQQVATTTDSSGYAMVMVNPAQDELLVQLMAKKWAAESKIGNVSSIRMYGQISSPNLAQLNPAMDDGSFEWTFLDKENTEDIAMSYMRPGFVVTKEMAEKKGLSLDSWVKGFFIGQYYLQVNQYDITRTKVKPTPSRRWILGSIFPAMPCPSLAAYGVDKKDYFTSFNTGSEAYVISQARLDSFERTVLIMVKVIRAPPTDITGVDVTVGEQNPQIVLSLGPMKTGGGVVFSRFYLQDFDVFNFQQGKMNFVVKTSAHPNGEVRGRYQMSTCYLSEFVPKGETEAKNTAFTQVQVAMDGTEAFLNMIAMNTTTETGAMPFADATGAKEESALLNVVIPFMNGQALPNNQRLPGIAPPPVTLTDAGILPTSSSGSTLYPLLHVTFGGSASAMNEITSKLVMGQVSQTVTGLSTATLTSVIKIKVVEDPSKYVVEEGDTLASIAKKKGFDTWVPLQMVNRLTTLNLKVGQVLDLCYRHRVMTGETIYAIAEKYGLSFDELYPLNPQLFDKQFIYKDQYICVMPALKRIMCGYKGAYTIGVKK